MSCALAHLYAMSHLPRPLSLWTLKFRHFKEAIRAQVMQRHALDHPLDSELEAYLHTQLPLEEEVLTAFHAYRTRALAIKDLLSGEELKVAWSVHFQVSMTSCGFLRNFPSLWLPGISRRGPCGDTCFAAP